MVGVSVRGQVFWRGSHGQVAPCPFPTASGYRTPFLPRPARHTQRRAQYFIDRKTEKKQTHNLVLRLLAGHARRPPHATNRLLFSKYLSIEIRTSFPCLLPTSTSFITLPIIPCRRLKNEQSFDCISKDSSAAPIAISLGKGPPVD